VSTPHLSGLNLINQLFSHCCKLSKSLCRTAWSSVVLILLYRRQSSANSRVVDETTDGKSLIKSRNKRGSKTVPWGTPEETVVAADDWPSSTTHCVHPAESWLSNHGGGLWPHSVVVSSEVYCAAPCRRPWKSPGEYNPSVLLRLGRLWKVLAGFQLIVASWSHVGNRLIIRLSMCLMIWLWIMCSITLLHTEVNATGRYM
jgi:hypothetical protein